MEFVRSKNIDALDGPVAPVVVDGDAEPGELVGRRLVQALQARREIIVFERFFAFVESRLVGLPEILCPDKAKVAHGELGKYTFPAANRPIVKALQLPDRYLITPDPGRDFSVFLAGLERSIEHGISLVQLRAKQLAEEDYRQLAITVAGLCRSANVRLLLNCAPHLVPELGAQGVHLTGRRLRELEKRPLDPGYLVAASCHSREDVNRAGRLGLDFIVVSPVRETASHPGSPAIGFGGLQSLCEAAVMPVYALGGMQEADIGTAWQCGAQGIASIRGLWM